MKVCFQRPVNALSRRARAWIRLAQDPHYGKLRNVEKIDMEINSIDEDDDEFENIDTLPE